MGASFVKKVEGGKIKKIRDDLTRVDVQTAKASVPADEAKVKDIIRKSVGIDAVNTAVMRRMQHWCASVFKDYLENFIANIESGGYMRTSSDVDVEANLPGVELVEVLPLHAPVCDNPP